MAVFVAIALFVAPAAETAEQQRQHSADVTVVGCAGLPFPVELAVD